MNAILSQDGKGERLKLPGKIFKGVLDQIVPQTDTGELVEYTKAFG
jgi:hypothetical protein